MTNEISSSPSCADAAAGVLCLLALSNQKRKNELIDIPFSQENVKRMKRDFDPYSSLCTPPPPVSESTENFTLPKSENTCSTSTTTIEEGTNNVSTKYVTNAEELNSDCHTNSTSDKSQKRLNRLEQNRRAAKDSRERKKKLVNELQRSITFFQEANSTVRSQNERLEKLIETAQNQIQTIKTDSEISQEQGSPDDKSPVLIECDESSNTLPTKPCQKAVLSTDLPSLSTPDLSNIQLGATTQAMTNFQQAAAKAMQAAVANMQNLPPLNPMIVGGGNNSQNPLFPSLPNLQQEYLNNLSAVAFHQSMLYTAGLTVNNPQYHAMMLASFPMLMGPCLAWQQQQMLLQQQQAMPKD